MIWEGVSADPAVKDIRRVRVLIDRTEVEHPVVLAVMVLEELLRILSAVAVESLDTARRITHHDDLVRDVCKICGYHRHR